MDWNLVTLVIIVILAVVGAAIYFGVIHPPRSNPRSNPSPSSNAAAHPKIYVMQTPAPPPPPVGVMGLRAPITLPTRPGSGRYEQIGILTGEGGSSGSAAPDRTILPLFGRELDSRRGKWNYFTRTDGNNPVQVPVRYRNRVCDDEMVGCEEVSSDDQVHVPSLGRSFAATVYRRSIFG